MVFLCFIVLSLLNTQFFLFAWRTLPVSWLFDCSDLPISEHRRPHPRSRSLDRPICKILLFSYFFAVFLILFKKVALMDVFWGQSLFWFFLQIALADRYYRLIPDQWSLGIVGLGLLRFLFQLPIVGDFHALWLSHLTSLGLCSVLTLFLHILPRMVTGTPALGLGDVKLFFALATALTDLEFLSLMTSAALVGGAVAAVMILLRRTEDGVPYGTVLMVAGFLQLLIA